MEYLTHNGALWIMEDHGDAQVYVYVVYKHREDYYSSWTFDLTDADFSKIGTEFTTLENLRPFLDTISETFYNYGDRSRGSLNVAIDDFDQFNEFVLLNAFTDLEFKGLLQKELICMQ